MLIDAAKLKHWIDNFYGYGSWDARVWFVSYEEGGGELPEEVAEKVNHFYDTHSPGSGQTLCDIRDMFRQVSMWNNGPKGHQFANRYEYRFGRNAAQGNIWKNLIIFEHSYNGEAIPDLLSYQRVKFASPQQKREALITFYPLPSPHNHAWYYSWVILPGLEFIRNRAAYQAHVYQTRMHTLLTKIRNHKPDIVLMYGMENINALKQSVQEIFTNAKFRSVKGTKLHIPQHHRAELDGTTLLITTQIPTLRHGRAETGFDWEAFGSSIKS